MDKTTNLLATKILAPVILTPGIIGYYSYKTAATCGWFAPPLIFLFFVAATVSES